MRECRDCDRPTKVSYRDHHVVIADRPKVFIRDAKFYVCENCGEQGLCIQSLTGFDAEVNKLPEDNDTPTYFAVDYLGTWFRLPQKEY